MSRKEAKNAKLPDQKWKFNDLYTRRMSYGNVVTRSQTVFNRIEIKDREIDLFSNAVLQRPSTKQHLIHCMVGDHGALPRFIVTRSAATKLELDKNMKKVVKDYEKLTKTDPLIQELKDYQKDHPNLLNPEAAVVEVPEDVVLETEGQSSGEKSGYESSAGELESEPSA